MAQKLTADEGRNVTKDHNVGDLKKLIKECAGQMKDIKAERQTLNERAGEIRKRLKDAGVQTAAFDFALRVEEMEEEARDSYLDSLRLNFDALAIGAQGSLFLDDDQPDPEPPTTGTKKSTAKKKANGSAAAKAEKHAQEADAAGRAAALAGKPRTANPHNRITSMHEHWDLGWQAGHRDVQRQQNWDAEAENQKGVKAGLESKDRDSNPWPDDHEAHAYWDRGWIGGQRQLAAKAKLEGQDAPAPVAA